MKLVFFILVVVASIPAVWQILTPGYFPVHDNTQVVRVQQMHRALLSGQFPVRWVPDLGYGYGYPIFNFYNPLPYYVGAGFMFLGLDALVATKTMMAIGVVLAGVSMFVLAKSVLKGPGPTGPGPLWLITALMAAMLYVYAPYHAVQIYVRGAVAEYWAYAILPLVFWALFNRRVVLGALSFAALILSHNLTAFMSLFFLLSSMFVELLQSFKRLKWKRSLLTINHYPLSIILALGLSAFFWLPALVEAPKTRLSEMVFQEFDLPSKHFVSLSQLWNSPWGYGGSSAGLDDGMSFEVGKIHLLGSLLFLILWLSGSMGKRLKRHTSFNLLAFQPFSPSTDFFIIGFLLSILLMLSPAVPIWNSLSILSYIQFPWRLLTFASLFASVLSAMTVLILMKLIELRIRNDELRKKFQFISIVVLLITSSFILWPSSLSFFQPQFKFPTTTAELTSRERIVWEVSKRSDEYLPIGFIRPKSLEEALHDGNAYNQQLVNELKKPTTARRVGNLISFLSVLFLIWKGLTLHTQD